MTLQACDAPSSSWLGVLNALSSVRGDVGPGCCDLMFAHEVELRLARTCNEVWLSSGCRLWLVLALPGGVSCRLGVGAGWRQTPHFEPAEITDSADSGDQTRGNWAPLLCTLINVTSLLVREQGKKRP